VLRLVSQNPFPFPPRDPPLPGHRCVPRPARCPVPPILLPSFIVSLCPSRASSRLSPFLKSPGSSVFCLGNLPSQPGGLLIRVLLLFSDDGRISGRWPFRRRPQTLCLSHSGFFSELVRSPLPSPREWLRWCFIANLLNMRVLDSPS